MFIFQPTAKLKDFERVAGLKEAWSAFINDLYETHLYGKPNDRTTSALEELRQWGCSDSDLRVFNPASMEMPAGSTPRNVNWSALPTSFDEQFNDRRKKLAFLDAPQRFTLSNRLSVNTRLQDEYCEWVVKRNAQNKIIAVIFTSEPPEYYDFLFDHSAKSRTLLVDIYRKITGIASITLADLVDRRGEYDWYNYYNNEFAIHMQQPNNTLGAQVNIVSRSSILRVNRIGTPITDALGLIRCAGYGDAARQSDPRIGHAVNGFARKNCFITIENPVGLYMSRVDWNGWKTPDGTDPRTYWKVERGTQNVDPNKSYIVRAIYSVPANKGYTVSDIKIGGEPIEFGGQIAARINMRVAVLISNPAQIPSPRAIGGIGETPRSVLTPMAMAPRGIEAVMNSGVASLMRTPQSRGGL